MMLNPRNCVAFTGHRTYRGEAREALSRTLEELYAREFRTFLSGMAAGFDLVAAEAVLELRERHPEVRLVAAVLRHFNDLPILGGANRLLGLVLGVGIGAVNDWVFMLVLWLASNLAAGRVPALGAGTLSHSFFYGLFSTLNPFLTHY